ncbi:MAG: response regulator transcription factor [Flavobacteriales bacterium]
MKILLVEDEKELAASILTFIKKEGYLCETAEDFNTGAEKGGMNDYDCAIVDITLPGGSGLDIVKSIKQHHPKTGIIIISAKNSLDDKITGLDLGADDYITKPFHLAELNSRIKSVLRRRNFDGNKEVVIGRLKVLPESQEIYLGDKPVELTKKEFALLLFFIANKNRVLTKEALAEHLWGEEADIADSFDFIYSHIKNLRKKLSAEGQDDLIQSVYGMGYKFSVI